MMRTFLIALAAGAVALGVEGLGYFVLAIAGFITNLLAPGLVLFAAASFALRDLDLRRKREAIRAAGFGFVAGLGAAAAAVVLGAIHEAFAVSSPATHALRIWIIASVVTLPVVQAIAVQQKRDRARRDTAYLKKSL